MRKKTQLWDERKVTWIVTFPLEILHYFQTQKSRMLTASASFPKGNEYTVAPI